MTEYKTRSAEEHDARVKARVEAIVCRLEILRCQQVVIDREREILEGTKLCLLNPSLWQGLDIQVVP